MFRTVPVEITDKQFNEWDKLLSRSGKGKKTRIRFQTLQLMKNKGGLALPCLKHYYISAKLKISHCWCNHNYQARRKEMEEKMLGAAPIPAHLGDKKTY